MNPKKLKRASVSVQKLRVVEAVTLSSFQSGKDFKFLKSNWSTNILVFLLLYSLFQAIFFLKK